MKDWIMEVESENKENDMEKQKMDEGHSPHFA